MKKKTKPALPAPASPVAAKPAKWAMPPPASPTILPSPKNFWAVFRKFDWDCITVEALGFSSTLDKMGGNITASGFIPVFDSYEAALDWNGGDASNIVKLETAQP